MRELVERLNGDAECIARRYGLRYKSIEPERANVKNRYGICYSDGVIKIRLRHALTRQPLKYSSLVNTLCHELAHLRHFNHGERFKAFDFELLAYARGQGIYRPAPRLARAAMARGRPQISPPAAPVAGPLQLDLF